MNEGKVTTSLADVVYEQVERDILTGVYKRGDVLTELKLSQRLQVSRTPVREALRRLEQDDLVECQGKSIVVMGVTHQDLLDLLEIRLRLEGMVTARCCQRITPEVLTALDEIITLQDFYVSRNLPEKIQESDGAFHRIIYAACGSRMLEKQLTSIHKRLLRYRKLSVSNRIRAKESTAEHKEIFQALVSRDAALSEALAIRHVERARDNILHAEAAQ